MAITTNLEFSRSFELFGDPCLTTALLNLPTYQAKISEFNGHSYRSREGQQQSLQDGPTAMSNSTHKPGVANYCSSAW